MRNDDLRRKRTFRASGIYPRCKHGACDSRVGRISRAIVFAASSVVETAKTIRSHWAWVVFLSSLANGCSGQAFSNRAESWHTQDSGTPTVSATGSTGGVPKLSEGTGGTSMNSTGGNSSTQTSGSSTTDGGCLCHGDRCDPWQVACNIDTPRIRTASNCRYDDSLCPAETPIYCWEC